MIKGRFVRLTVDVTPDQAEVLEALIQKFVEDVFTTTGLRITVSKREFFHMLLEQQAAKVGLEWPRNYPEHGGPRRSDE